jgi:nicotinamidase-related amidase
VIDMQDEFVKPGWTPHWSQTRREWAPRARRLIADCRALKIPVIFTAFAATHHGHDRPKAGAHMPNRHGTLHNSDLWFREGNIWHELRPEADDVIIFKPSRRVL